MNELMLIPKPPYNPMRIVRKICMVMSRFSLMPPGARRNLLKMGGYILEKDVSSGQMSILTASTRTLLRLVTVA